MRIRSCVWACAPAVLLVAGLVAAPRATAQATDPHVVSREELHQDAAKRGENRQADESAVRDLLKTPEGQEALRRAKVDYQRVDKALAQMSDEEVAKMGSRARQAHADFAAGALGSTLLIVVILILVLAIVLAVVF